MPPPVDLPKIILGLDPGKNNTGFCVLHQKKSGWRINTLGMINTPLHSLLPQHFELQALRFYTEINNLLRQHRPHVIIIERMINRGRFFGASTELVSVMIGIVWGLARRYKIKIIPTTAASWKNQFHRTLGIKLGAKNTPFYRELRPLPDHVVDAALIALFASQANAYADWTPKFFRKALRQWQNLAAAK